jgi:hypothetical protein
MVPNSHRRGVTCCAGRGLCRRCYKRARLAGRLADYERRSRSADEALDEWTLMRSEGYTVPQAAARMGMSAAALFGALARAKRRGDPRAVFTYAGQSRARREAS